MNSLEKEIQVANKHFHRFVSYKHIFFRGVLGGLGWSIGATVVIALLFWILSQLTWLPFIGDLISNTGEIIEQNRPVLSR